jgi:hypothetical protein
VLRGFQRAVVEGIFHWITDENPNGDHLTNRNFSDLKYFTALTKFTIPKMERREERREEGRQKPNSSSSFLW